ncbi:hypothetical protein L1987_32531 [Smallanthus sonchifolius]|uniref:Uncharacterized protein n=1 Tax=Smallanthus sonchifolius TaxID=185202 RepID=A0ACB9HPU2_9ASTR|nr:hypothetical protein L1987_32531 [Smallanthus sonchifolius]
MDVVLVHRLIPATCEQSAIVLEVVTGPSNPRHVSTKDWETVHNINSDPTINLPDSPYPERIRNQNPKLSLSHTNTLDTHSHPHISPTEHFKPLILFSQISLSNLQWRFSILLHQKRFQIRYLSLQNSGEPARVLLSSFVAQNLNLLMEFV